MEMLQQCEERYKQFYDTERVYSLLFFHTLQETINRDRDYLMSLKCATIASHLS